MSVQLSTDYEYGSSDDIESILTQGRIVCALCGENTRDEPCQDHQPAAWAEHFAKPSA